MPIIFLPKLLLSLFSLLILAAAVYLLWTWFDGFDYRDALGNLRRVHGADWRLYLGVALLAWSFLGRSLVLAMLPRGEDEPREERSVASMLTAPDGSVLHIETSGQAQGPTLVLTHGWGLNSTAWWYTKHALQSRFRIVAWDLPGLGRSTPPTDGRVTIDRFAEALGAVVSSIEGGPIFLVGHSIGGMTTQTFWRACAGSITERVSGAVLVDTTYENPIKTMWLSPLWRALRWPVIEPLMWMMIAFSSVVWLSSWQSYLSGTSQLVMRITGFGRHATRGQVDFVARLACKGSPGLQAKGNLAMFRWHVQEALPFIPVPLLILTGTKDIVTLPSASRQIASTVREAELREMDGAGHMGFMERAEAYNHAIAEFASRVPLIKTS